MAGRGRVPGAFGLPDTMRGMGDHLAGLGYVALVPDVFYRAGDWPPFDPDTAFTLVPRGAGRHPRRPEQPAPGG